MLPEVNGYELLDYIPSNGNSVIFLTAKTAVDDRVKGLLAGAEDYITKPFAMAELQARMEVVLRRFHKVDSRLTYDNMEIDVESRKVMTPEGPVSLTPKEFDLLVLLVRNRVWRCSAAASSRLYGNPTLKEIHERWISIYSD